MDDADVYRHEEVERFAEVYFTPKKLQSPSDHQKMNAVLDPAVDRFRQWKSEEEEEAELWRGKLVAFRNLYGFLSQIIPYQDTDLEKLYTFLRFLSPKLPRRATGPGYSFDDEVRLKYYRLQKISEGSISLSDGKAIPLEGPTATGTGLVREERVRLSKLIEVVNERFGTDFTESDQLFFDQVVEAASMDASLKEAAAANPEEKFALVLGGQVENLMVERMEQNEEIVARYMSDPAFQAVVNKWVSAEVYERLRRLQVSDDGSASYSADRMSATGSRTADSTASLSSNCSGLIFFKKEINILHLALVSTVSSCIGFISPTEVDNPHRPQW